MAKLEKLAEYEMRVKEFYEAGERLVGRAKQNHFTGVWSQSQFEHLAEIVRMMQSLQFMIDAVVKHNR